jgi:hypothetical protein
MKGGKNKYVIIPYWTWSSENVINAIRSIGGSRNWDYYDKIPTPRYVAHDISLKFDPFRSISRYILVVERTCSKRWDLSCRYIYIQNYAPEVYCIMYSVPTLNMVIQTARLMQLIFLKNWNNLIYKAHEVVWYLMDNRWPIWKAEWYQKYSYPDFKY